MMADEIFGQRYMLFKVLRRRIRSEVVVLSQSREVLWRRLGGDAVHHLDEVASASDEREVRK